RACPPSSPSAQHPNETDGRPFLFAVVIADVDAFALHARDASGVVRRAALPAGEHPVADLEVQVRHLIRPHPGLVPIVKAYVQPLAFHLIDGPRIPRRARRPQAEHPVVQRPAPRPQVVELSWLVVVEDARHADGGPFIVTVVVEDVQALALEALDAARVELLAALPAGVDAV